MLHFVYEDDIKIKNKNFVTIQGLHVCPIKPSAASPVSCPFEKKGHVQIVLYGFLHSVGAKLF
jgi:predicted phosphohydrolase